MNNVRTVSDTKRAFYTAHTRPVNSIYRRVVEELMVEMHLLSVNVDFRYDPIYALGVVTSFDRFMQAYQPATDISSIFGALCQSVLADPAQYRQDAARLQSIAQSTSAQVLIRWMQGEATLPGADDLSSQVRTIASNPKFKYSRLFAIGLYTLLETADPELVKEEAARNVSLQQVATALNVSEDKLKKDLELYRSNLDKLVQVRAVMEDALQADRKKREEREKAKAAEAAKEEPMFTA